MSKTSMSTPLPARVYLASQSPRRLQLLAQWGVQCELLLPDPSEDAEALEALLPGDTPRRYVQRVTRLKLQAALQRLKQRGSHAEAGDARGPLAHGPVLCADTTVALGRQILGKPQTEAEAVEMLTLLAGRSHRVLTAVAVGRLPSESVGDAGEARAWEWHALSESRVTFAPIGSAEIRRYVDTGEPMGKAGAYGIQGNAALWISHISGSYTGIMGLPAFETAHVLRQSGIELL